MSFFCSCISKSAIIHSVVDTPLPECPICLVSIAKKDLITCDNDGISHPHHMKCVKSYSSNVPEGEPVRCTLGCGHVFKNILGKSKAPQEPGPDVELNIPWLQERIETAQRSGLLTPSRSTTRYLQAQQNQNTD